MGARKLEELLGEIPKLREDELSLVISLVDKIKEQRTQEYIKHIEQSIGKYKNKLSSVDEFLAAKKQEREKENS